MEKREQLYEGKAKKVYATDDAGCCIVSYKDDATAFDGQKKGTIAGKGAVRAVKALFPEENVVPIDYDPSATRVNQENRIKLMLATARENLKEHS